jgi:hypothetical protein
MPLGGLGGKIGYKVIECDHFEASTRTAQPEEPKTITDLKIKTEIPETHDKLVVEMPVPKIKTRKPLVSTKSKANSIENKCSKRPERPVDTMIEQKRCIVCGEPSKGDCCGSPVCKIFYKSLRKKVAN